MKINKSISKVLVCTKKEQTRQECIKIDQENLDGVKKFFYLRSKITWGGRSQKEIKSRIAQFKTKTVMLLLNQLRKQEVAIEDIEYVWSIAMYGSD